MIPPLDSSKWVVGDERRLLSILLRGLSGPIEVNRKLYDTAMTMPSLSENDLCGIPTK